MPAAFPARLGTRFINTDERFDHRLEIAMSTNQLSSESIHLQHKRELLLAEKSFIDDKLAFVKKSLQAISQELSRLRKK